MTGYEVIGGSRMGVVKSLIGAKSPGTPVQVPAAPTQATANSANNTADVNAQGRMGPGRAANIVAGAPGADFNGESADQYSVRKRLLGQ